MLKQVTAQRGMASSGTDTGEGTITTTGTMTKQDVYSYPEPDGSHTDAPTYSSLTEIWEGMDHAAAPRCNAVTTTAAVTCYTKMTTVAGDEKIIVENPDRTFSEQTSEINAGQYNDGMWLQTDFLSPSSVLLNRTKVELSSGPYATSRPWKIEHTDERSQTKKTELVHGAYNQVTSQKEFDYGQTTTFYREKRFSYENGSGYIGHHVFNLLKTAEDFDGSGNRLTRTEYGYDNGYPVETPDLIHHVPSYDPYTDYTVDGSTCERFNHERCMFPGEIIDGEILCECKAYAPVSAWNPNTNYRGNLTSVTTYENAATLGGPITYTFTNDVAGNQRTATTNCCEEISSVYSTATEYSQPDSVTRGSSNTSSPDRITQSFAYDTSKQVPTTVTDYNGHNATITYDPVMRPTVTTLHTGARITNSYNDSSLSQGELVQKSVAEGNGTVSNSTVYFNGRGQPTGSTYQSGPSSFNGTQTRYDVMGRWWQVSMPYSGSPSNWTVFAYDYLSRVVTQTAPDGSVAAMSYAASQPSSAWSDAGTTVLTTDAWGRERWTRMDAFGRMVEAVEPDPASTSAEVSATGNIVTSYAYDHIDRLTGISQGSQSRSFRYDSLSRLTRQKLAEQPATINDAGTYVGPSGSGRIWSESFVYDTRSNLTQRTDTRGVKTNISYSDPLNRLQSISYDKSQADTTYTIANAATVYFQYMSSGDKTRVRRQR